jgi:nucleotide-binding universal stress UspA family protein
VAKTIVVGYDDREPAQHALERAIADAKATHAHLLIVAVDAVPLDPNIPPNFGTLDDLPPPQAAPTEPPEIRALIAKAKKQAKTAGVHADSVWAIGDPARTIVDVARDNHASTIVLGSHHHSLLGRLFGQDVAAAVKHEAGCEVLVVE